MLPKDSIERYLLLVLFAMFLLGLRLLYQEIKYRQKRRRELYGLPPTQSTLSEKLRYIREHFQRSDTNTDHNGTKKAA